MYIEKISTLPDTQKYLLLNDLIKKYGREFNKVKDENPLNIYCIYGNKTICCKHHLDMIDILNDSRNYKDKLELFLEKYGTEHEGKHWCTNCGEELYISDYESVEGFKKSGARDVTHEIVEDDEDKYNSSNTSLPVPVRKTSLVLFEYNAAREDEINVAVGEKVEIIEKQNG